MGASLEGLYDHEGYAARKLAGGTLTAYIAACDCGRTGEWFGSTEHPPTDAGEQAALDEWEQLHARPLLAAVPPAGLAKEVKGFLDRLAALAVERPIAVLGELRRIERRTDALLDIAVEQARASGKSWSEIGAALGMTKQSAQQRFTRS